MVSSEFRKVIRNEKTDIEYREVFVKLVVEAVLRLQVLRVRTLDNGLSIM